MKKGRRRRKEEEKCVVNNKNDDIAAATTTPTYVVSSSWLIDKCTNGDRRNRWRKKEIVLKNKKDKAKEESASG